MRRGAVVALLVLAMTGCTTAGPPPLPASTRPGLPPTSSSSASATTTTEPTSVACRLLTRDEVRAAAGVAMEPSDGAQGTDRPTSICAYRAEERILVLRVNPESGDQDHAAFPYGTPRPVPGLGDDAKFAPGQGDSLSTLSTVRGRYGVTVLYRGPGDHREICTRMAQAALAHI
ncbi:MAG: DUF3558 family protein [Acidimicrobiales bacterium]